MTQKITLIDHTIESFPFDTTLPTKLKHNVYAYDQWPIVYMIVDDRSKEIYIGESTNTISRLSNHLANPERRRLQIVYIIASDKFNKSVTLDLEAGLIKYIAADGKYKIQNISSGVVYHNFYQREAYLPILSSVWKKLQKVGIVQNTITSIENSDLFKYSPYKALSTDQLQAVTTIVSSLLNPNVKSIIVQGGAGTGKTILAIYIAKLLVTDIRDLINEASENNSDQLLKSILELRLSQDEIDFALVIPMTSLRSTLKTVFKNIKGLKPGMVIGPSEATKRHYQLLIIDEAHRLRQRKNITNYKSFDNVNRRLKLRKTATELDWLLKKSGQQIFFYDADQSIKPADVPRNSFVKLLKERKTTSVSLVSQLRSKGGKDYVDYVQRLMHNKLSRSDKKFNSTDYEFLIFHSFSKLIKKLRQKETDYGLCRLIAGYAWQWKTKSRKKSSKIFDIEIEKVQLSWNSRIVDWINSDDAFEEVGCIHTTQGYDLNFSGIIFGPEIGFNFETNEIEIYPEKYHDRNGKAGVANNDELKTYILNIYSTLLLRAINGTYIYAHDKNLRAYFSQHIQEG